MVEHGYGAIAGGSAVREPSARNRLLLSYLLSALAVAAVVAVVWLGHAEQTTTLAQYDPNGIADT